MEELNHNLNNDLCKVYNWLVRNKLSLNVKKTELIILGSNQRLSQINDDDVNVNINDVKLNRVELCKHLGVLIDENLSWNNHVQHIVKNANSSLYMFKKAKPFIPSHSLKMLYNGILAPHFDYCDTVWGTCNETTNQKLQKLQNRAAKVITGGKWYDSSTEARNTLNWKTLRERYSFHLAITMFKVMNDEAPAYLVNRFNVKVSGYDLRGYKNLAIPKPKTESRKRSISYAGATLWNSLPDALKKSCNISRFKCKYFDDCNN